MRTWSLLQNFPTSDTSLSFIFIENGKGGRKRRLPRVLVTVNHLQLAFLEEQLTFSFHFIYLFVCRRVPSAYKQRVWGDVGQDLDSTVQHQASEWQASHPGCPADGLIDALNIHSLTTQLPVRPS